MDIGQPDENAKAIVRQAIMEFGVPAWVAHVPRNIREQVPQGYITELRSIAPDSEGWGKQSGGRELILSWAKNNVFSEVTVKELAEIGKVSEATARSVIANRPDIFRKSEWGKYEVRDAQADRKADK